MSNTNTPLHNAARSGNIEIVKVLLSAGYDPNAVNAEGFTPLHIAAQAGHVEIAELLLNAKNKGGNTGSPTAKTPPVLVMIGRQLVCGILILLWVLLVCLTLFHFFFIIDMINNADKYIGSALRPINMFTGVVFCALGLSYLALVTYRMMQEGGLTWIVQNGTRAFMQAVFSALLRFLIWSNIRRY